MRAQDASAGALAWPKVKLGHVSELCLGKMLDAAKNKGEPYFYLRNPDVRWFDVDTSNLRQMPFESHELDRYGLLAGDVLICEGGEAGRAAIWSAQLPNVKFQKAIHRVRTGPELLNRFLVHRLKYDFDSGRLADYYTGATIKHLTGRDLARYEFSLPPIPDQQRIAAILDKADALRTKRREAIAKLDQLLQSVFLEMFGDPLKNPKGWPQKELSEICDPTDRVNYGVVQPGEDFPDGVPLIRVGDIDGGQLSFSSIKRIDPVIEKTYGRSRLNGTELLVSCVGSIGTVAYVPEEARGYNIARAITRVPLAKPVNRAFVRECLRSPAVQRYFSEKTRTVSQPTLNVSFVKSAPVICPPASLITKFCEISDAVERKMRSLVLSAEKSNALFAALQKDAFSD